MTITSTTAPRSQSLLAVHPSWCDHAVAGVDCDGWHSKNLAPIAASSTSDLRSVAVSVNQVDGQEPSVFVWIESLHPSLPKVDTDVQLTLAEARDLVEFLNLAIRTAGEAVAR